VNRTLGRSSRTSLTIQPASTSCAAETDASQAGSFVSSPSSTRTDAASSLPTCWVTNVPPGRAIRRTSMASTPGP